MHIYTEDEALIEQWQWRSPPLRNLDRLVLRLLRKQRGRVLDLGCGSGRLAVALARAGFQVDGIDIEARVIELGQRIVARESLPVRLYTGDILAPDHVLTGRQYDIVTCSETLEHVGPWEDLLQAGTALLRPGGLIVITVPRDPGQFTMLDSYGGHLRRFQDRQLLDVLAMNYTDVTLWRPGWPFMRTIVWLYTTALTLRGTSYEVSARTLWREPTVFQRAAMTATRGLLEVDNLFKSLPFGTHMVVRARKVGVPVA